MGDDVGKGRRGRGRERGSRGAGYRLEVEKGSGEIPEDCFD